MTKLRGRAIIFLVVVTFLGIAFECRGAVIPAASCNLTDVQAAIALAAAGDTVTIPAGNCAWTAPLSLILVGALTIEGAGAEHSTSEGSSIVGSDVTTITADASNNSSTWVLSVGAGISLRITGIAFIQSSSSTVPNNGIVEIGGSSNSVRVDHCHFYAAKSGTQDLVLTGDVLGVADHDFFDTTVNVTNDIAFYNGEGWNGAAADKGDASWTDTDHWGTNKFFFAEDDYFNGGWVGDCDDGGRYVLRYSTINNSKMASHGTNSSRNRGCRAAEIYHNNATDTVDSSWPSLVPVNSGGALAWDNTISGYEHVILMDYQRSNNTSGSNIQPTPNEWGFCGPSPIGTGSASVSANSTSVTGTNFSTSWASGSTIYIPGASCTVGSVTSAACEISSVQSATALTLATASTVAVSGATYTAGSVWDGNSQANGYPCLDAPARGAGDLLTGSFPNVVDSSTGTAAWPHQALDPVYAWGNTLGTYAVSFLGGGSAGTTDNLDYYQQFGTYGESGSFTGSNGVQQGSSVPSMNCSPPAAGAGPGYWDTTTQTLYVCSATDTWTAYYTPYTYPDPLQTSTSASIGSPTNLTITSAQ